MKKNILFIFIISVFIGACEKDDFCILNPITPKLVLRFYDDANKETLKDAKNLSIWAESKDTIIEYKSISTDSVAIPLNSLANETIYHLKVNNENGAVINNEIATFTIKYITEEEYISRSCGYKVIFNEVTFAADNTWIKSFTPATLTTIDNQNTAHVQIFH